METWDILGLFWDSFRKHQLHAFNLVKSELFGLKQNTETAAAGILWASKNCGNGPDYGVTSQSYHVVPFSPALDSAQGLVEGLDLAVFTWHWCGSFETTQQPPRCEKFGIVWAC